MYVSESLVSLTICGQWARTFRNHCAQALDIVGLEIWARDGFGSCHGRNGREGDGHQYFAPRKYSTGKKVTKIEL